MKKYIILSLVLALCVLSACVPVGKTYVCSDGKSVSDPSLCTPTDTVKTTGDSDIVESEPVNTESRTATTVTKRISADAQELIDKSLKANYIRFNYFVSSDPVTQDEYVASRDKVKVTLANKAVYSKSEPYDTAYLNLRTSSATAYCEQQSLETCGDKNKAYAISFDRHYKRTPFEWLDMIETADLTGKSKQIDGRTGKEISFTSDGVSGMMFIDSFFGLPLEVVYGGVTYKFQSPYINNNKEADLSHQFLEN